MSAISIPKGSIQLAGLLYKPSIPTKTPALVVVHPGGGVKEQTAGLYARKLSEEAGFTTICFDASHQGESGGEPHFLEDPSQRVSDVFSVIDYLSQLDTVDPDRIGVLDICAGGGYAVAAAKADHRLRAVATVSMVNIGDMYRKGWYGDEDASKHVDTLKMAANQIRTEVENGAELAVAPYVPPQVDENTPKDFQEAHEYYLTPRAQHARAENKMLLRSLPLVLNFDASHLANLYLTQPVLLIAGENAGSRWHTERLDKLIGGASKNVTIPKATHMDLYDKLDFFGPAVKEVAEFMKTKL